MTPDENKQPEEWRPVPDWEGFYEVSDQGRVRSLRRTIIDAGGYARCHRGRVLRPMFNRGGYPCVALHRPGQRKQMRIHILVAEVFIGPRPPGMDVCHANDVKTDNRVENLRYATRADNMRDRVRNGLDPNARKTHCIRGHEFTPENTAITPPRPPNGRTGRRCRECSRGRRAREKAAAA